MSTAVVSTLWRALRDERHKIPYTMAMSVYLSYTVILFFGLMEEMMARVFSNTSKGGQQGQYFNYVSEFSDFFYRRAYTRVRDCFDRPLRSSAGRYIDVAEREFYDNNQRVVVTQRVLHVLNFGSYNYLGFCPNDINVLTDDMQNCLARHGPGTCLPVAEGGRVPLHRELETAVARFLGRDSALVFGMGYATNSTALTALGSAYPDTLVLSDKLNHTSIIAGIRQSQATCRVFRHNDMTDLRMHLKEAVAQKKWKRVLVVVEGLYSMEGDFCSLQEIIELKKEFSSKLPVFLYLDEAHSIGAIGATGRGLTELLGVSVADVDVMMGTFSKSFASTGGYVCGDQAVIDYLRVHADCQYHLSAMSPLCCQQVITCLRIITDEEHIRIHKLQHNVRYFRERLATIGFHALGDKRSPVVPIMLHLPARVPEFSRFCLREGVAVVVVGYPATTLTTNRVRICLSAALTQDDMDRALDVIQRAGERLWMLNKNAL